MRRFPESLGTSAPSALGTVVAVAALLAASYGGSASARDAAIVVNSFDDLPDANLVDGVCDADLAAPGNQ